MSKNVPTNMALYNRVKREAKKKFDVWPSAYASSWLVREYKKRGGKYKKRETSKKRSRVIRTGPRGGRYYIKGGKKVYV